MNILVVGGAGYIGSHMVRHLQEHSNHGVVVLDDLSKGHGEAVNDVPFVQGDFGDRELVTQLCETHAIEAIMHFGAWSLVGESVLNPEAYYENNVVKGKRLLDGARTAGVRAFVFSSTAATYGEPLRVPIQEDDPTVPTNPYGRSKLSFEGMLESYRVAYGLSYVSLRYFNAAGAHSSGELGEDHKPESHLIPIILQVALGQRDRVKVFGDDYETPDGTCVRDYIHIVDLATAHLLALDYLRAGNLSGIFNLGNGQGFSVNEVIEVCRQITGHPLPTERSPRRPGDPAILVASSSRAREVLGWQPQFPIVDSIVETAWNWHRQHPKGYTTV